MRDADLGPGETLACPHCDIARLSVRSGAVGGDDASHDAPYYCKACLQPVHDPVRRERRAHAGVSGLAADLLAADPGEVVGGD